jgi:Septum formation
MLTRAVALPVAALVALGACSGDDHKPSRDADGVVTHAGTVSVFDLQSGDCLNPPADLSGEIADIKVVPCARPHTQEVFAKVDSTADAYPGGEQLATEANNLCVTQMQSKPLDLSPDDGYFWSYLLPSFNGWNKDSDRTIVCVFVFPNGPSVTGSVVAQALAGTVQPGDPPPVSAVPPTLDQGG